MNRRRKVAEMFPEKAIRYCRGGFFARHPRSSLLKGRVLRMPPGRSRHCIRTRQVNEAVRARWDGGSHEEAGPERPYAGVRTQRVE